MPTSNPEQQRIIEMLQASGEAVERYQNNISIVVFIFGVFITLFLISLLLFFSVLIDALSRKFNNSTENLLWLLIILSFPVIGPLLYLQYIKPLKRVSKQTTKETSRRKRR